MLKDAESDEERHGGDDYDAVQTDPDQYADHDGYADDDDAMHGEWREPDNGRAYWRRRFFILCGGIAALGVCAWLLPGPHQPSKRDAAAASASIAADAKRQALPSAAKGPGWSGSSSMPNPYPTAQAKTAKTAKKAYPGKKPAPSASPSGAKAGACPPADIVLSLTTSQPSYHKGEHPSFDVYAVSTLAAPCTMAYGAGSVRLVVTRHGRVMWDSNACKPTPAGQVRFTRGVPQVLTMVWNPTVKKPAGCAGKLPSGAGATLDAVAMTHGHSSPVHSFKLSN